jgi:Na+/H+ antiporter NhaB
MPIKLCKKVLTSVLGSAIILMQIKLGKGDTIMNKDEILRKAQAEKNDEREQQVRDKSMMCSYIVMVLVAAMFSFIRSEQGLPIMDLTATVSASCCATLTYRYVKTKQKSELFLALVMLFVAIVATIRFFMGH